MPITALGAGPAARLGKAPLTYAEAGMTAGTLPPDYHHLRRSVVIGSGAKAFAEAADAVMSWQTQLRAGLRVAASSAMAEPGAVVVTTLRLGPVRISAPCRVVYVVDEPRRRGFAYGTLPGHPERGEEAFTVELGSDEAVIFTVTAFSTPASALTRAAGPLGRVVQRLITDRYLGALAP